MYSTDKRSLCCRSLRSHVDVVRAAEGMFAQANHLRLQKCCCDRNMFAACAGSGGVLTENEKEQSRKAQVRTGDLQALGVFSRH